MYIKKTATTFIFMLSSFIGKNLVARENQDQNFWTTVRERFCTEGGLHYEGKKLIVEAGEEASHQFLLYNMTSKDILIDHPVANPSTSAGWAVTLAEKRLAIFMVNQDKFTLSCAYFSETGNRNTISCQDNLAACQLKDEVRGRQAGTYWLAENMTEKEIINLLNHSQKLK